MNLYPKNPKSCYFRPRESSRESTITSRTILGNIARLVIDRFPGLWRGGNSNFSGSLGITLKLLSCVAIAALWLYEAVCNQNELTKLRLEIPVLAKDVEKIKEGNIKLSFEIEKFESPAHLMELSRLPQYRHLIYPYHKDVLALDAAKYEPATLKKDSR